MYVLLLTTCTLVCTATVEGKETVDDCQLNGQWYDPNYSTRNAQVSYTNTTLPLEMWTYNCIYPDGKCWEGVCVCANDPTEATSHINCSQT